MSTQLTTIARGALQPAQAAQVNDMFSAGIKEGGDFLPVLKLSGRQFHIKQGKTQTSLDDRTLDVVLVSARPSISKTFYKGKFVPGADGAPDCQSANGLVPDAGVPSPQSTVCATCPQNAWGSKINEATGAAGKACADKKVLVLAPPSLDGDKPLQLDLPAASLKNFATYIRLLSANGLRADQVVTKLVFTNDTFPKLDFKYVRNLAMDEIGRASEIAERDDVQTVVNVMASGSLVSINAPEASPSQQPTVIANPAPVVEPVQAEKVETPAEESPAQDEVASILGRWSAQKS